MATLKIINGTIITGGESFVGNVVLKDGVIEYVGTENPEVPADAETIDATGLPHCCKNARCTWNNSALSYDTHKYK